MQEIDVKTGLVMYEWTSLDHVALERILRIARNTSTTASLRLLPPQLDQPRPRRQPADLRPQHLGGLRPVDPRTGAIIWRLGGKNSSFNAGPGTRTAWQHDARELPDGTISLFDNGSSPKVHPQSRGIVISLNPQRGRPRW